MGKKAKKSGKRTIHKPLTEKQKRLIKAVRRGLPLAKAAKEAGYKAKSDRNAAATAFATLRRLTGRPVFRDALKRRGVDLEIVANYVQAALDGKQVTTIYEYKDVQQADGTTKRIRTVAQEIVKDDGRSRGQALKWIMEAYEASQAGEQENPWDGVSDEELEVMAAAGPGQAPGAGRAGAAAPPPG